MIHQQTLQPMENLEYQWLLHYYREFCEFEVPTYLNGKSLDCKILLETGKEVYFQ